MPGPPEQASVLSAVVRYLRARPRIVRWREWLRGRRYRLAGFRYRTRPFYVIAFQFRDAARAEVLAHAVEYDWSEVPERCREAYNEILSHAPQLVVVQLSRTSLCGCLGHCHPTVREAPFAMPHEVLGGDHAGEMDIVFERIKTWQALPLSDTALDAKFLDGSRQEEFRAEQFRLRLLSVLLHETNHLVFPREAESSVRGRSLTFYRDALSSYAERAAATLSLTIDRSFSRLG